MESQEDLYIPPLLVNGRLTLVRPIENIRMAVTSEVWDRILQERLAGQITPKAESLNILPKTP